MKKVKNFISFFDLAPASYTPTINYKKHYKSSFCGCLSLCCLAILLLYILYISALVFGQQNFNVDENVRHDYVDARNTQSMNLKFNITLSFKNGSSIILNKQNQLENGLNFTFIYSDIYWNRSKEFQMRFNQKQFQIPFQQCGQQCDEIWKSSSYNQSQYYEIRLEKCSESINGCHQINKNLTQICVNMSGIYQYSDLQYYFFSNDDFRYSFEKDHFFEEYLLEFNEGKIVKKKQINFKVNGIHLFHDSSILPFPLNVLISFIYQYQQGYEYSWYYDSTKEQSISEDNILHKFSFKGNAQKNLRFQKTSIDSYFGSVLGILTIMTIFINALSCGFKKWLIRVQITKTLNEDKQKQIMSPSVCNYFKYMLSLEEAKNKKQKIEETEKSLDIVDVVKHIKTLQKQNQKLKKAFKQKIGIEIESESGKEEEHSQSQIKGKDSLEEKVQFQSSEEIKKKLI